MPQAEASPSTEKTLHKLPPGQLLCLLIGVLAVLGFGLAECVSALEMDDTAHSLSNNIFYYLFSTYDRWHLIFLALTSGFFFFWMRQSSAEIGKFPEGRRNWIAVMALAVIVLGSLGTHIALLNYPFAMDEFYADFQAAIFAQGKLFSPIPAEHAAIGQAATPLMMAANPVTQTWTSNYLPVYALLRTPFFMAGVSWLFNPLLAGLTIFAMAGVIRRIWPDQPSFPWLGVILLASNVQFLVTSMTAYSMPAHLLANLVWLWLYLDPSPKRQMLAPMLGILAMGLHQPNVHLIFAFPFGCKLLLDRRWKMAAWHVVIYALGGWLWLNFMNLKAPPDVIHHATEKMSQIQFIVRLLFSHWPNTTQLFNQSIGVALILAWSSFVVLFLAIVALLNWKKCNPILHCLIVSLILAFGFYFLVAENQGHGWGNRYMFPYLGNILLLAVAGYGFLDQKKIQLSPRMIWVGTVGSFLLLLPARAWECRREVTPFALSSRVLRSLPQNVLVIDTTSMWYGQDLVRNAPGLANTPKLIFMSRYTDTVKAYCDAHPPSGRIGYNHLVRFGMKPRLPLSDDSSLHDR